MIDAAASRFARTVVSPAPNRPITDESAGVVEPRLYGTGRRQSGDLDRFWAIRSGAGSELLMLVVTPTPDRPVDAKSTRMLSTGRDVQQV